MLRKFKTETLLTNNPNELLYHDELYRYPPR
jgi:hypothetical protein